MEKKNLCKNEKVSSVISDKAAEALLAGEVGNRGVGTENTVVVGNMYTILGIDMRENIFKTDKDVDDEEFRGMSETEKLEHGVSRKWLVFTTDLGDLSFSAVMGNTKAYKKDFWVSSDTETEIDLGGYDIEDLLKVAIKPIVRVPKLWIANECKTDTGVSLIGRTIKCVATHETPNKFNGGETKDKTRLFIDSKTELKTKSKTQPKKKEKKAEAEAE